MGLPIHNIMIYFAVFASSLLLSVFIASLHPQGWSRRNDVTAVQSMHERSVSRLGGVAVVGSAFAILVIFLPGTHDGLAGPTLFASALPVFIAGVLEDLGRHVRPRDRFLAAMLSGAAFIALFEQWLTNTKVPVLDLAMQWAPFAMAFSILLAAGVSHAFNLVDGLNGLAGFIGVSAALCLAYMAHEADLSDHRGVLLLLACAICGFLALNFPFGRIFLGDAGAYVIGHSLVWLSISILCLASSITPWAMLLIFFWPVADTLLAILRRLTSGRGVAHPDRLHFHHLVLRSIEVTLFGRRRRSLTNPIATLVLLPLAVAPMVTGVLLMSHTSGAALACLFFASLFLLAYKRGVAVTSRMSSRRAVRRVVAGRRSDIALHKE